MKYVWNMIKKLITLLHSFTLNLYILKIKIRAKLKYLIHFTKRRAKRYVKYLQTYNINYILYTIKYLYIYIFNCINILHKVYYSYLYKQIKKLSLIFINFIEKIKKWLNKLVSIINKIVVLLNKIVILLNKISVFLDSITDSVYWLIYICILRIGWRLEKYCHDPELRQIALTRLNNKCKSIIINCKSNIRQFITSCIEILLIKGLRKSLKKDFKKGLDKGFKKVIKRLIYKFTKLLTRNNFILIRKIILISITVRLLILLLTVFTNWGWIIPYIIVSLIIFSIGMAKNKKKHILKLIIIYVSLYGFWYITLNYTIPYITAQILASDFIVNYILKPLIVYLQDIIIMNGSDADADADGNSNSRDVVVWRPTNEYFSNLSEEKIKARRILYYGTVLDTEHPWERYATLKRTFDSLYLNWENIRPHLVMYDKITLDPVNLTNVRRHMASPFYINNIQHADIVDGWHIYKTCSSQQFPSMFQWDTKDVYSWRIENSQSVMSGNSRTLGKVLVAHNLMTDKYKVDPRIDFYHAKVSNPNIFTSPDSHLACPRWNAQQWRMGILYNALNHYDNIVKGQVSSELYRRCFEMAQSWFLHHSCGGADIRYIDYTDIHIVCNKIFHELAAVHKKVTVGYKMFETSMLLQQDWFNYNRYAIETGQEVNTIIRNNEWVEYQRILSGNLSYPRIFCVNPVMVNIDTSSLPVQNPNFGLFGLAQNSYVDVADYTRNKYYSQKLVLTMMENTLHKVLQDKSTELKVLLDIYVNDLNNRTDWNIGRLIFGIHCRMNRIEYAYLQHYINNTEPDFVVGCQEEYGLRQSLDVRDYKYHLVYDNFGKLIVECNQDESKTSIVDRFKSTTAFGKAKDLTINEQSRLGLGMSLKCKPFILNHINQKNA